MKKMSKSIKKYLADNIPMNKPKHEGQSGQNHPRLAAYPQIHQDNNSIYCDVK